VLALLIELGAQFVAAHEGSLLVVDEASNELVFAMTVGRETSGKPLVGQRVPIGKGLVGLAAQTHQVQIGAPTFHLPQDQENRDQAEAPRAEIAAPLLIDDTLIGVITAVSFQEDKRFSSADALLYARIAWVIAVVIDQRRRLAALQALSHGQEVSGLLREMNVWTWRSLPQSRVWPKPSLREKPGLPVFCRISSRFWRVDGQKSSLRPGHQIFPT